MEGIQSYEQKSSSETSRQPTVVRNRVVIVNRCEPDVAWSTPNQPVGSRGTSWLLDALWAKSDSSGKRDRSTDAKSSSQTDSPGEVQIELGPFASNEWRTSKYTLLNFLPKNLFEQFRRIANFYFLITAILQILLPYSPVGPATSLMPLLFVVSTTAVKQAYEDHLRHKLDSEVNSRLCHVLRDKRLVKIRSKDIRVGDFVYVKNNEEIPCDMILLAASGAQGDRCYVTTANLDGETNLKSRTCFHIKAHIGNIERLDESLLVLECERPNATLYEFNGHLRAPRDSRSYRRLVSNLSQQRVASRFSAFKFGLDRSPSVHTTMTTIHRRLKRKSLQLSVQKSLKHPNENRLINLAPSEVSQDNVEIPLDISNLLLRASRLRNTSFVYGLAVYTGCDTKLAHNSHVRPNKFSTTESKVNSYLLFAFALLLAFSFIGAITYRVKNTYYITGPNQTVPFEQLLVSHFLLYNYMVPISLYVTLEFVKFFGLISVVEDEKLKTIVRRSLNKANSTDSTYNCRPDVQEPASGSRSGGQTTVKIIEGPKCNSSDLNEELGQVEVLFTDKTGTLTENKMLFVVCSANGQLFRSLNGKLYLEPPELAGKMRIPNVVPKLLNIGTNRYASIAPAHSSISRASDTGSTGERGSAVFDHRQVPPVVRMRPVDDFYKFERVAEFLTSLCLCSTITLNEQVPLADCLPGKAEHDFQSASPDEESLISAASAFGVVMCKADERDCFIAIERPAARRTPKASEPSGTKTHPARLKLMVETKNSTESHIVRHFERLLSFDFNSVRKRMSVVYRDCDTDTILLVAKGSESLLDCINLAGLSEEGERHINVTLAHFEAFAKSGLRTMLVASRILSKQESDEIAARMKEARMSSSNREQMMGAAYKLAESNLRLMGSTAVEDTLQEGVPETIANLREAGVKVWLLTGDKVETALSVAYLCRLLDREMTLFNLVRQQDSKACIELLNTFEQQISESKELASRSPKTKRSRRHSPQGEQNYVMDEQIALVADGRSLHYAMKYSKRQLALICRHCTCVLGCRLSPLQKAEIVDMIRTDDSQTVTAAIGDGANDVSMIQEAHVGIGISGKEGRQAVNSSDFAINRFHMLNRLLFVHGHLFYHRTANTIHYFFYKNLLFVLPQFFYLFFGLSSAMSLYYPVQLMCYNLIFTSLPILVYGLHEIHIPESILEAYPRLYRINRRNGLLRFSVFIGWLCLAAVQAAIAFFWLYIIWGTDTPFLESAKMAGRNGFSTILYFVIILTGLFKLYLLSRYHTCLFNFSIAFSCMMMPAVFYSYNLINWSYIFGDNSFYGIFPIYLGSPLFWLAMASSLCATILPDLVWYIIDRLRFFRTINSVIALQHNLHD